MFGLVVSPALISALILMNYSKTLAEQLSFVVLPATLAILLLYAFSAAAVVYLLFMDPEHFSRRTVARNTVLAALALAYASGSQFQHFGMMGKSVSTHDRRHDRR